MSCGVRHRCGSDLAWLWLWGRPAAVVLIRFLAWGLPYAVGVALKSKTKQQTKNQKKPAPGTQQDPKKLLIRQVNEEKLIFAVYVPCIYTSGTLIPLVKDSF